MDMVGVRSRTEQNDGPSTDSFTRHMNCFVVAHHMLPR